MDYNDAFPLYGVTDRTAAVGHEKTATVVMCGTKMQRGWQAQPTKGVILLKTPLAFVKNATFHSD